MKKVLGHWRGSLATVQHTCYAFLLVATWCLGNIPAPCALADGRCECNAASSPACEVCSATPRICGLGNGLLDCLDKASERLEANFFRLRAPKCSESKTKSREAVCVGCDSQNSSTQPHCSHCASQSPAGIPSANLMQPNEAESYDDAVVPTPIPDPFVSPSSPAPREVGNPFLDEVRHMPVDKSAFPVRSALTAASASQQEFNVVQVDVKPVPKHLLHGHASEKSLVRQGTRLSNPVVPAGSIQPSSTEVLFAR